MSLHNNLNMKKLIKSILGSFLVVTLASGISALHAQSPSPSATPAASPAKEKHPPFHGVVSGVDVASKSFTFTSKSGNVRNFTVGPNAVIMNGETTGTFSDIQVGSYVRGIATKIETGKFDVVKVTIGEKPAKSEATAGASPVKKKSRKKKDAAAASPSPAQ